MATNRFTKAAKDARNATNKELSEEIARVSTFSQEKLKELLPTKKDKEAFVLLMEQVEKETSMDNKIAYLQENIQSAGKIVFTLLKAFI